MESYSDIKAFDFLKSNSSQDAAPEDPIRIQFNPDELFYNMSGGKLLVIFNHTTFNKESTFYYKENLQDRIGTKEDVQRLDKTFTELGFEVILHNNKTYEKLWAILDELRERDMSSISCICFAFLTHGAANGDLCAYNRPYPLQDVLKLFQNHSTLAGKPKLFFIQACRGQKTDAGNRVEVDGDGRTVFTIPSHADFLVMRSTVEDHLSYRDCRGSWMMQELCNSLMAYHQQLDILHIATLVHKAVAFGYATNTPKNKATNDKVQMIETTFTLTKFLKF